MSTCYVPGTLLGTGDIAVNMTDIVCVPSGSSSSVGLVGNTTKRKESKYHSYGA